MSDAAATAGRTEFTFDSADGQSQVRAVLWVPLSMERADAAFGEPELGCFKPRGVVQLIHGMAEHIDRYDDFARFLADAGYLVAGHDHIGHGDTAGAPERRGVIDAEGGADAMIEDAQMLRLLVSQQVASGTPYFIFGHSMGSLVLRSYLPRYGSGLAGAIICGTANEPVAVSASATWPPGPSPACAATTTAAIFCTRLPMAPTAAPSRTRAPPSTGSPATRPWPTPSWLTRPAASCSAPAPTPP
ncbi:MAG: alpha/beta fold hydrolase [Adlercreutzia sp.]